MFYMFQNIQFRTLGTQYVIDKQDYQVSVWKFHHNKLK